MKGRPDHYLLVGQTPVPCDDLLQWAMRFEIEERRVRLTRVGPYFVSTVFLGLDHNFSPKGPPLLFETMVFLETGEKHPNPLRSRSFLDHQWRCATWPEAEKQHEAAVREVQQAHDDVEQIYPQPLEKLVPCFPGKKEL
jgi:hypothetical protein